MMTGALPTPVRSVPTVLPRQRLLVLLTALAVLAALTGCASFSPDGGFTPVAQTARDRLGKDLRWSRSDADRALIDQRVDELLARPLSADDAVQVALLNNRGLQAGLQDLGISEAELKKIERTIADIDRKYFKN